MTSADLAQCGVPGRRARIRAWHGAGIDSVEAEDDGRTLVVTFLGKAPRGIGRQHVRIDGGRRITGIHVVEVELDAPDDPELDDRLRVTVDRTGDRSTYRLSIVESGPHGRPGSRPYPGLDPRYASAEFIFQPQCPSDADCVPQVSCPPGPFARPVIDYTARDYASLRRALLDRMTLTVPRWVERHAPDLPVTLVELLAYVGDQLSYFQDAVATEAYLDTARRRISVRRHVRLIDYRMHEGCNARAWVYVETDNDEPLGVLKDIYFLSSTRAQLSPIINPDDLRKVPFSDYEVFEPITVEPNQPLQFHGAHNRIPFYTWHERECCLARGVTTATLLDEWVDAEDSKPPDHGSYYPNELSGRQEDEEPSSSDKSKQQARVRAGGGESGYLEEPCEQPPPAPRARRLKLEAGDVLIF